MAIPISFHPTPVDARAALRERVERAPEQHAEAVLAAFDLLQMLHEHGMLDIARSALAASDTLIETAVDQAKTPETIRAIRNLLFWRGVLGRIEPEWFRGIFQAVPEALARGTAKRDGPVSLFALLWRMRGRDSLRGLATGVDFLESFGRHLHALEAAQARTTSDTGT